MVMTELNSFAVSVITLVIVVLLKAIMTHVVAHEPLRFFRFYCQLLSNKVNLTKNSDKQRTIAGLVAVVVTLLPLAIILWLFEAFVEVAVLWQGLLLYLAMASFGIKASNKSVAQALVAKQNYLAKQSLQPWLLRETEQLSSLGLSKAAIEMQLLRTLQQGYVVAFIFLFVGPLSALMYRLLLEMHYCWNSKVERYRYFGLYAGNLAALCQWLPVRLFSLTLLIANIGRNFLLFWRLSRGKFFQLNNDIAIMLLALSLEVRLGGVAMYDKQKLRKVSFNDLAKQPEPKDIIHADTAIKRIIAVSFLLVITVAVTSVLIGQ